MTRVPKTKQVNSQAAFQAIPQAISQVISLG